ncbi:hypothetical protein Tco_0816629, partial [Tanacetum coccineum]
SSSSESVSSSFDSVLSVSISVISSEVPMYLFREGRVGDDAGDDDEERVLGPQMARTQCLEQWVSRKRISEKRMKNQAKNDKTNYGMEKRESQSRSQWPKSQSQDQPRQSQ